MTDRQTDVRQTERRKETLSALSSYRTERRACILLNRPSMTLDEAVRGKSWGTGLLLCTSSGTE